MPPRTEAYLPGFEKGHVNASSLGGVNTVANVCPQHADVNHGGYYSMEAGERSALSNGAQIYSEKTAFVDSKPGDCPGAFLVIDRVTFSDGHTERVSLSFTNESYAVQAEWNEVSAALPDTFVGDNPADPGRSTYGPEAYAELMTATDLEMPNIDQEYLPADFCGEPAIDVNAAEFGVETSALEIGTDFTAADTAVAIDSSPDVDVELSADADPN